MNHAPGRELGRNAGSENEQAQWISRRGNHMEKDGM